MGELLYKWSTAAQLVSVFMIALFYATLARSVMRAEVRWWARAWWFNFGALALTLVYWVGAPEGAGAVALRSLYVGAKIAYALLLVQGVWALRRAGAVWLSRRNMIIAIAATVVVAATLLRSLDYVGIVTQGVMGLLFTWCGVMLLRERASFPTWLGMGFLVRGGFSLVESVAYGAHALPPGTFSPSLANQIGIFLGAHSSLDLAAEWLLALGGVMTVTSRGQQELQRTNGDLLSAQDELRRLADRDPLTGLANRRALPQAFRAVHDEGAMVLFFDLDGFKAINDAFGHAEGDASLVRYAEALRACFRPSDAIVRYAGDEFVVVAIGMTPEMANGRVEQLRRVVDIAFSAGIAELKPGGDAGVALKAADQAMYRAKGVLA
ncbi:MAG: GGDEF domain-containing protein [Gemmatimonadaceae bacterium]